MGNQCPKCGPFYGKECPDCGWRPKKVDAAPHVPSTCQLCPTDEHGNVSPADVLMGQTYACWRCYEGNRTATKVDVIRNRLLREHQEWRRQSDESRDEYFQRMRVIRRELAMQSGVRRMPA